MDLLRKAKIGMLFIGAERFCPLGEGTANGTYLLRKETEYKNYLNKIEEFADVVHCGMVYTRQQAQKANEIFNEKDVDCVVAIFMSWAEDYAWISFLKEIRDDMPLMLASVVRDEITIKNTNDENEFIDFLSAGALVGFLEASGSIKRFKREKTFIEIGTLDEISKKINVFSSAAKAKSILGKTTISLLSCYNEAM